MVVPGRWYLSMGASLNRFRGQAPGASDNPTIWFCRRSSLRSLPLGEPRRMRLGWLFGRSNVRAPWIVASLVLINALMLRALDPSELSRLRDFAFDSYQRLQPRTYNPETPVRIVDIDEAALAQYGQWPWPRTLVARLVNKLTEKGAAVIAFDVVF